MNIKCVLGGIVLALVAASASRAQLKEPLLSQVKFMKIKGISKTNLAEPCLSALKDEFRNAGLTIRDTTEGADAEMSVVFELGYSEPGRHDDPGNITYALYTKSLPEHEMLWVVPNGVVRDSSGRQCKQLAGKLSKDLLNGLAGRKIDIAFSSEEPSVNASVAAPTLGRLEINVKYTSDDGAVRPIGPVGLRLSCTNPVTFSHQITTSANGHVEFSAPCGTCRLESASPVRLDGKRYVWNSDVEISPERTTVDLLSERAPVQDGTDASSESHTPPPVPTAAGEGVEPILPTRDVVLPVLLVGVEPEFPDLARRARIEGKVILQAVIGVDGHVTETKVLSSSNPMFNNPSIQAVSQRMYRPAHQDGKPVRIYFMIRTDFRLR